MSQKDKNAVESHLEILMMHIIKILIQSYKKTRSWLNSIKNARDQIRRIQRREPSINKNFLSKIWDMVFKKAKKRAEEETGEKCDLETLDWKDVFDKNWDEENPDEGKPKK